MVLAPLSVNSELLNVVKKISAITIFTLFTFSQCKKSKSNNNSNITPTPGTVTLKDSVIVQGLNFPWEISHLKPANTY